MQIQGTFKDINENIITVKIYNVDKTGNDINIDTSDWIKFSDDPVTISTDCDDTFTHIIKKTCKIQLIAKRWMGEYLFANNATSIVVNVFRRENNVDKCLFAGYVVPCTYNQDYANSWDTIDINCIDNIGVLEYRQQTDDKTWAQLKAESQMRTFKYLMSLMHFTDTNYIISNMPQQNTNTAIWVETGYDRVVDPITGEITYYAIETQAKELDANTAVATTNTVTSSTPLTVTYMQSTDFTFYDGLPYYKKYAYVEVNNVLTNTGDWILGDLATELIPTVVGTVRVLDGWTYGPTVQPFEYYEHFRLDNEMSDGRIKRGESDAIGDRIPETPSTTTNGSYYEFRQGDEDDLDIDESEFGLVTKYYKNYAWIIMIIDEEEVEYKTSDWVRGSIYVEPVNPEPQE